MSLGFNILVWPDGLATASLQAYLHIVKLVTQSPRVLGGPRRLTIYGGQRPFEYGFKSKDSNVISDEVLDGDVAVEDVMKTCSSIGEENVFIRVALAFDTWQWNSETCDCDPSVGWLYLEYLTPGFEQGYEFIRSGPHRIRFDNIHSFSARAVNLNNCAPTRPETLVKLAKYGENTRFVEHLFQGIASQINPLHMMVVTEGDRVNPLNFHMVYHAEFSGYLFDVRKILQLHQRGGGYFYDGLVPEVDRPYASLSNHDLPYQDDIRDSVRARELMDRLNLYGEIIPSEVISTASFSDEAIREIVTTCEDVEVGEAGGRVYLMHAAFLFGYLETPYLRLLDHIAGNAVRSSL